MATVKEDTATRWTTHASQPLRDGHPPTAPGVALRRTLVLLDVVSAAIAWSVALHERLFPPSLVGALTVVVLVAASMAALGAQRLYLARVCAIRAVEIRLTFRAALLAGVGALVLPRFLPIDISTVKAVAGGTLLFLLANAGRAGFRAWLQAGRRRGRFLRPIVIVGGNDEAFDLFKLIGDHPETGFTVCAVAGEALDFPPDVTRLPIGPNLATRVKDLGASGVIIASSALHHIQLNRLVRAFHEAGLHVHLSSGLRGVDHRRLRSQPVAHEPLFYVEGLTLAPWQRTAKRTLDVAIGALGALVSLPALAVAAIAIKLDDGGPVFYRQVRPGLDEQPFTILKLRTMSVGADRLEPDRIDEKMGPRSKVDDDPRRTRVGRILERSSIDELPQLWNVLRGEMSLVGPRPALVHEAEKFDDDLKARFSVPPGVTGLWQVEARDNPSFAAYRRYDLFYIENWSVGLDLAILAATAQQVALRGINGLRPRRRPPALRLAVQFDDA
jgi:exopolysaccharide biosynthesis polyprenyl glycosylphosphotransferase